MDEGTTKRVLVVDDEKDVLEVLKYVIEDEGYVAVTATTVEDALARVAEGDLAAAVLDVSIGAESGDTIVRALRSDPASAHVPVILLTGLPESAARGHVTSYDHYVNKGAELGDLMQQVAELIARRS